MSDADPAGKAAPAPRRVAGGFTVAEYERRVWDMAGSVLHAPAIYVLAFVAAATRLLQHPASDGPGALAVEGALFAAAFLGAWACFYSTLLRDAGLPSLTITVLAPAAAATALALWFVAPGPDDAAPAVFWTGAAALALPAPLAFALTWRRWRRLRREHAHLLPEADR